jgi:hypothetical protein
MSLLTFSRSRGAARLGLVLVLAATLGCGPRDTLLHGVEPSPDGSGLQLSAMMPRCGCITLQSVGTDNQAIELVSKIHDTEIGSLLLPAGEGVRVGFDWAGAENNVVYTIEGYHLKPNGRGGFIRAPQPLTPLSAYLERSNHTDVVCRASDCAFGTLRMDRELNAASVGGQPASRQAGVEYMNGGQQIWAASSPNSSGCMMITNINPAAKPVILRSALHAQDEGSMEIGWDSTTSRQPVVLVGFDSAGTEEEDYYLLTALAIDASGNAGADQALATKASTRAVRAEDHIRIVGQMDRLECSAEGAVLWLPAPPGMTPEPGSTTSPTQVSVTCPFGSLAMREIVTREGVTAAAPPAIAKRSQ